jgi:hypothetical protein
LEDVKNLLSSRAIASMAGIKAADAAFLLAGLELE